MFHTRSRRLGSANRNCAGIDFPIPYPKFSRLAAFSPLKCDPLAIVAAVRGLQAAKSTREFTTLMRA